MVSVVGVGARRGGFPAHMGMCGVELDVAGDGGGDGWDLGRGVKSSTTF